MSRGNQSKSNINITKPVSFRLFAVSSLLCLCAARGATAQAPVPPQPATTPQGYSSSQNRFERVSSNHWRFIGQVEIEHDSGVRFFADDVDLYTDTNRLIAKGNVVFVNPEGRISAERLEFNTRDQVGTFYQASGIMSLGAKAERVQFGGQEPDVYFYGETVAKVAERKYRITKGGFTTCVQPTPRWELTSGTVTLNLDDYALLTNTVLRVKGVPVFYLPVAYYPMQEDQRATGFLLPTYGTSTLRGQAISNAFFWAISRSQDATFFHDWFTRAGQGYGTEYRYIAGPLSEGNARIYRFDQKQIDTLPAAESFEVRANAVHSITRGLRARAHIDYSSNLLTRQLYHQNLYNASLPMRVVQTGLTGAWGPYNTAVTYDRTEIFSDEHNSFVQGSTPRVTGAMAPKRLFGKPIYASFTSEYANVLYRSERDGAAVNDAGLARFEVAPLVRVPVSRWTFLTLNTSAAYRLTRYSESLDARGIQVPEPFTRSYFDLRADAVGPVFTKIWDAAADSSAERYKHMIEPTWGYQQTSPIENYQRAPILSNNADRVVGSAARLTYGLTNRLLRRDRPREGTPGTAREFLSIAFQQTYYSEPDASRYDPAYASSLNTRDARDLSPIAVIVRYSPTVSTTASMRLEHDVSGGGLQTVSATGSVYVGGQSVNATLSRYNFSTSEQTTLNSGTSLSFMDGRTTGNYALTWDLSRGYIVNQTLSVAYFAQCCGFGVEFQNFNYGQFSTSVPIPADRRINFSFTLAGLGTFSNFFGAFGGNTQR